MGLPEMDLGTVPAWGGSARLTRCVGRAHSLDMILRGKKISGPRALEIGLVNEVWPNDQLQQKAKPSFEGTIELGGKVHQLLM